MSFEALVISHILTALAAVFGTHAFLRNIAGWKTAFEHSVGQDLAAIKQHLGLSSVQTSHAPPAVPHPLAPVAPIAGGGLSSPASAGAPPPIPVQTVS